MPRSKYFILFIVVFIFLAAFYSKVNSNVFEGDFNESFVKKLASAKPYSSVIIRSNGGYSKFGFMVNEAIYNKKIDVIIDDYCFSACAEYVLLASKDITFVNEPIIGFHGNALLHHAVLERYRTVPASECYNSEAPKLLKLYSRIKANSNFWKEQEKRLIVPKITEFKNGCPYYRYEFAHKYWYPTSDQLENLMGIKFSGSLCADNPACIKARLIRKGRKGTSFVVGDEVYISKGP